MTRLRKPLRRQLVPIMCVAVVVLLSAALRLFKVDHYAPYVYHPDEPVLAVTAMDMVAKRDWNPHWYTWPSGMFYVEAGTAAVVRKVTHAPFREPIRRFAGLPERSSWEPPPAQFPYFVAGRIIVAALGTLTVLAVFGAGVWAFGFRAGLAGSTVLAASALHVENSHYLTTDVPAAFLVALTLALSFRAFQRREAKLYVLAAATAGLAASTKYNAGLVWLVPMLAYLLQATSARDAGRLLFSRRTLGLVLAAAIAFIVATPGAILDTGSVVRGVLSVAAHYGSGHVGAEGTDNWLFYARSLATGGFGPVVAALLAVAIGYAAWRRTPADIILLTYSAIYSLPLIVPVVRFERNLIPLLPALALLVGRLLGDLMTLIWPLGTRIPVARAATAVALAALIVAPSAVLALQTDARFADRDTRTIALEWIETHLPAGARIIRGTYTPRPGRPYLVGFTSPLSSHELSWYQARGAEYLVASSYEFDRFTAEYPEYAFYQRLLALPRAYAVSPTPGVSGPSIYILRLAPSAVARR